MKGHYQREPNPGGRRSFGSRAYQEALDRLALKSMKRVASTCIGCGGQMSENCAAAICQRCGRAQIQRWEKALQERKAQAPKATHIAGYVPPKGSVARSLLGHVIPPLR